MNKEKVHRRERLVVCMNKEKVHRRERLVVCMNKEKVELSLIHISEPTRPP